MKIKVAVVTVGVVWFVTVYGMLFTSVGALLTTVA